MKTKVKQVDGLDARLDAIEAAQTAYKASGTGSIPTAGWVANTGDYPLKVDVAITGILATDYVSVDIDTDLVDVAQDAEIASKVDEYNGGLTFYCKTVPTVPITFEYTRWR